MCKKRKRERRWREKEQRDNAELIANQKSFVPSKLLGGFVEILLKGFFLYIVWHFYSF